MMTGCVRAPTFAALSCLALAGACSDGGGGQAATPVSPPPTSSSLQWTAGVFEPASLYKDQCEAPRSGVDIEGNPFPDQPGSLLEENFWLRSWTNETYLWNTEVLDRDPILFDDRLDYFAVLRTTAVTASGRDKDQFHFSEPTEDYLETLTAAPTAGYGARLFAFSTVPPRDYRAVYTEPNSPAEQEVDGQRNLVRGTRILEVDGIDLINGGDTQAELNILNDGLFPATAGESHDFVVQDPGAAEPRSITMISVDLPPNPVNLTRVIDTPTGPVGYIVFNTFSPFTSEEEIADAISQMDAAGVTDLILDLRYNGGGLIAVAAQLGYMVAGDARTVGRTFELLQFNEASGDINPVTGQVNEPVPFYDTGLGFSLPNGAPLDSLDLSRVFVLTTEGTCSASESVINGLRGVGVEVIIIGDTTCGKPFGFYPTDNCGETYFTIQFQGVNDAGFGEYADGFAPMNATSTFGVRTPGCAVPDDLTTELGDDSEGLLAAALAYRASGVCPAVTTAQAGSSRTVSASTGRATASSGLSPAAEFLRNNRDMTMPR